MSREVLFPQPQMAEDAFYDLGFMNEADDFHFMAASSATEEVHFPYLLDDLSPGFGRHPPWPMVGHIQHVHLGIISEGVGSSPDLKSPALILSPLLLLRYQP
jgi:hypothetical protein